MQRAVLDKENANSKSRPAKQGGVFARVIYPNRYLILIFIPGLLFFIIFHYVPMFGIVVAFKDYSPYLGVIKSPWVGLKHFVYFFSGPYAWRVIRNTILLSFYSLLFGFPAPIILALLLNELRSDPFKRVIQTVTYFPYFLSMSVVAGLVVQILGPRGIVNQGLGAILGMDPVRFLSEARFFRPIYVTTNIWKGVGFSAIIYLAAIAGVDPNLYEAAIIDGANRWRRIWHVTLPAITPTIVILLILNLGHILTVGIELVLLLYNPLTYETADVIGTFVYRYGISGQSGPPNLGLGAAVGVFQSLVGFVLIITANRAAKAISETSLW